MEEVNEEDDVSTFRREVQELEKKFKEVVSCTSSVISRANKILRNFENRKKFEYKDINNKLSEYAQDTIQDSKGPLKPEKLLELLMNDVFGKKYDNALALIRKYSNDTDGVRKQLSQILKIIEKNIEYRKNQNQLDRKFVSNVEKLNKAIEQENLKETDSNKRQSNLKQFFKPDTNKQSTISLHQPGTSKQGTSNLHQSNTSKQGIASLHQPVSSRSKNSSDVNDRILKKRKDAEGVTERMPAGEINNNRKRKVISDNESCDSQESGMTEITSRLRKRVKINSSDENAEKSSLEDVEMLSVSSQDTMSGIEEYDRQDVQSNPEGFSTPNLEEPSSQDSVVTSESANDADLSSEDDSSIRETRRQKKSKSGVSSEQPDSGFAQDSSSQPDASEETISEANLYSRKRYPSRNK